MKLTDGLFLECFQEVAKDYPELKSDDIIVDDLAMKLVVRPNEFDVLVLTNLIYSPLGQRSGAHMNPAVTLTFLRLGKINPVDAAAYVSAQFIGGATGIVLAGLLLRGLTAHPSVNHVATIPGPNGSAVAFASEVAISFLMMTTILTLSNHARLARYTGLAAGLLVATYIVVEAPFSGMSMNPARTRGSNVLASMASSLWIYFTAPPIGMLLAGEWYLRRHGASRILCAKLHHTHSARCIFHCGHMETRQ
jgi:aquaporin Z